MRPLFKNKLGLIQYLRNLSAAPTGHLPAADPKLLELEPLEVYRRKATKMDWLLKLLTQIQSVDEKALVFCEFRDTQRVLHAYIQQALGYDADVINGDTSVSAQSAHSRQKRIDAFQAQSGFGVLILSPVAVGFGVNIQAANHVIHYTRCWNPAKEDQATDRAYRIGQLKDVYVYCPQAVAPGWDSFDVTLDRLLASKRALADDIFNGATDVDADDFPLDSPTLAAGLSTRTQCGKPRPGGEVGQRPEGHFIGTKSC